MSTYQLLLSMYAMVPTPERTRESSAIPDTSTEVLEAETGEENQESEGEEEGEENEPENEEDEPDGEEDEPDGEEDEPEDEENYATEERSDIENSYEPENVYAVYASEATDTGVPSPENGLETESPATSSGDEPWETREDGSTVYAAYSSVCAAAGRLFRVGRASVPTFRSSVFGGWHLRDLG
jgi:hypothetical protein